MKGGRIDGRGPARLLAALAFSSLYILSIAWSMTDADVVLNRPVNIAPVLLIKVSAQDFLIMAEIVLVLLFLYYHVIAYRHRSRNGPSGPEAVDYGNMWFFSDLATTAFSRVSRRPHGWWVEYGVILILVYVAPLFAILTAGYRIMALNEWDVFLLILASLLAFSYTTVRYTEPAFWGRLLQILTLALVLIVMAVAGLGFIQGPVAPCLFTVRQHNWTDQTIVRGMCQSTETNFDGWGLGRFIFTHFQTGVNRPAIFFHADLMSTHPELQALGTNAVIAGPELLNLNLRSVTTNSAIMEDADIQNSDLSGGSLWGADLQGSFVYGSNFALSSMSMADLSHSQVRSSSFNGALLDSTSFQSSSVVLSSFDYAEMQNAFLDNVIAFYSTFRGADLSSASLNGSRFIHCDLSGAKGLTQAQLNNACGSFTILPKGLKMTPCN
jgi:uncharacterized protein YjbI with pentapeptide repeats